MSLTDIIIDDLKAQNAIVRYFRAYNNQTVSVIVIPVSFKYRAMLIFIDDSYVYITKIKHTYSFTLDTIYSDLITYDYLEYDHIKISLLDNDILEKIAEKYVKYDLKLAISMVVYKIMIWATLIKSTIFSLLLMCMQLDILVALSPMIIVSYSMMLFMFVRRCHNIPDIDTIIAEALAAFGVSLVIYAFMATLW